MMISASEKNELASVLSTDIMPGKPLIWSSRFWDNATRQATNSHISSNEALRNLFILLYLPAS